MSDFVHVVEPNEVIHVLGSAVVASLPGTLVVTDDTELDASHDGLRIYNTGADDEVEVTLPDGDDIGVGWSCAFRVVEAFTLRFVAQGDDVIRFETAEVASFESAAVGSTIAIEYAGGDKFFVVSHPIGAWSGP